MRMSLKFLVFFWLLPLALALVDTPVANSAPLADRVVVKKSIRKLFLYKGDRIIKSYEVSLGKNPTGHKQQEGDSKTPEGRYFLDWRNLNSRYNLALHISYPNSQDVHRAKRLGLSPGGDIMLHGLPNKFSDAEDFFKGRDWTDGCIAVTSREIHEIGKMVANNTPIEIYP